MSKYSLAKIALGQIDPNGIERELSREISRKSSIEGNGVFVPSAILAKRDLAAETATVGQETVMTHVRPAIADALIPYSALVNAGMTVYDGLSSNLSLPRWETIFSPSGLLENATVVDTPTATMSTLLIGPPFRISQQVTISKQLLTQAPFADEEVRKAVLKIVGSVIDLYCIAGSVYPSPTGILATPSNTVGQNVLSKLNSGTILFGASATWAKLMTAKGSVLASNVYPDDSMTWVVDGLTYGKWAQIQKQTGTSTFIIENHMVGLDKVVVTQNLVGTHQCIFGRFSDAVLGLWGIDVISNPYLSNNTVALTVTAVFAFGLLRGPSFVISSDSAAQ